MNSTLLARFTLFLLFIAQFDAEICKENREFSDNYFDEYGLKSLGKAGEGHFNKVVLIEWTLKENDSENKIKAVVKIAKEENKSKELEKEASILHHLHSHNQPEAKSMCLEGDSPRLEHVPLMYGCFIHEKIYYLDMEHIPGNLDPFVAYFSIGDKEKEEEAKKKFETNIWGFENIQPLDRLKIYKQMADGLANIHSKGIVHGDVKPENMLMDKVAKDGKVYIIDFGVSTHGEMPPTTTGIYSDLQYLFCINPYYSNFYTYEYGDKQDVYALALSIFELETVFAVDVEPFDFLDQKYDSMSLIDKALSLREHIVDNNWCSKTQMNFRESAWGDSFESVIRQMLACNREDRPKASEVAEKFEKLIEANQLEPAMFSPSKVFESMVIANRLLI